MKKVMMIVVLLTMILSLVAKEEKVQKEIGILFSNLNGFGLTYRTGTEKGLWRFNALSISGLSSDNSGIFEVESITDSTSFSEDEIEGFKKNFAFSISFGKEFRKKMDDKLYFRYGLDMIFNYHFLSQKNERDDGTIFRELYYKRTKYDPGIGVLIGFNYNISKSFVVGAEIFPNIVYYIQKSYMERITKEDSHSDYQETIEDVDTAGIRFTFSNKARLSLVYQF